jgi:DNA-binding MarR family transcriptional regulator
MRSHTGSKRGGQGAAAHEPSATAAPGARDAAEDKDGATAHGAPAAVADLGPLGDMIGYALRRAQLAVFDEAIKGFAKLDLRPAQYSVLALVGHKPGLKQSEVAAALGIQRANFVALLDGLERRGLARRSATPSDRRANVLHLTEEGQRTLRAASALVTAIEARLDARLGPGGRALLLDLLRRLSASS